jgi:hypothetical protein
MSSAVARTSPRTNQLLDLSPEVRTQIVFLDDSDYASAIAKRRRSTRTRSVPYAELTFAGNLLAGPLGAIIGAGIAVAIDVSHRASKPLPSIYHVVKRSMCRKVKFPLGHPLNKVVYIKHPYANDLYYPVSDFHEMLMEHKHLEAVRLLESLGASTIKVEHEVGSSGGRSVDAQASLGVFNIKGKIEDNRSSAEKISTARKLSGRHVPRIPKRLVWYDHELQWKQMAADVLAGRVSEYTLTVENSETYGVDASIKTEVLKYGLELGGEFHDCQTAKYTLTATFPQKRIKRAKRTASR